MDKTIYSYGTTQEGFGPKHHSLFLTFLFHGINIWTILRYLLWEHFNLRLSVYFSFALIIITVAIGYVLYSKKNRADRIMTYDGKTAKTILFILIAIIYAVVSVYGMIEVGNRIRFQFTGK